MMSDFAYNSKETMIKIQEKYMQVNKNEILTCTCPQPHYKLIFMDIDMPGKDGYQTSIDIHNFLKTNNK